MGFPKSLSGLSIALQHAIFNRRRAKDCGGSDEAHRKNCLREVPGMETSERVRSDVTDCFAEFYRTSAYGRFPQEHRSSERLGLKAFVVDQQAHDLTDAPCRDWVLGLPIRANSASRFNYGDGWRRARRARGDILLVPPATEVGYSYEGPTKLLVMTWDAALLERLDPEAFRNSEERLRPLFARYFKNAPIEMACRAIWLELVRTDPAARLMLDAAITQLAAALLRAADIKAAMPSRSRADIRRALAYIDAHFRQDISLADLAREANLSVFHFAREFRLQTGASPYQYVQRTRALAARRALTSGHAGLETVASTTGFGSVRRMREAIAKYTS